MNWLVKAIKGLARLVFGLFSWVDSRLGPSDQPEKRGRNIIILFTVIFLVIFGITSLIIFSGSRSQIPVANNLLILFLFNITFIMLIIIMVLVGRYLAKFYMERHGRLIERRFQTKLIIAFVTFTLIPSALLFIVASGLLTNAIDKWFNETVERSLRDSLEVAETLYKSSEQAVSIKAAKLAQLIKEKRMLLPENAVYLQNTVLGTLDEYSAEWITVYDKDFHELAGAALGEKGERWSRPVEASAALRLLKGETVSQTITEKDASRVFSLVPIMGAEGVEGVVLVVDSIDRTVVAKIKDITATFDEYKQLKLQKDPIKAVYEVTLLLVALIILFAAIWYGFYLAREITVPIYKLTDATEKVTHGDLSVRLETKSIDEIGYLIGSFNRMAEELELSSKKIESSHREMANANLELNRRRLYIETILAKIVTGVISIDNRGRLTTLNPAAVNILKLKLEDPVGRYYEDVFSQVYLEPIRSLLRKMGKTEKESVEEQVQVVIDDIRLTLLVHVTTLRDERQRFLGLAIVFDDLTVLINAQKTSAWRDIAQYMAHEIKNPLTPIQLNTERLMKRFKQDRAGFDEIFENSTRIIIQEVDVLKTLVDEFRKFAQLPEARPVMTDLHGIINDVVGMYRGIEKEVQIRTVYDPSIGLERIDPEQMHRVFRNLIENAIDAVGEGGEVEIKTTRDITGKKILIEVADNGPGIDPKNIDKVFLPYFSTKTKGSGLGLAIVNRIVADHEGHIRIKQRTPNGTLVAIDLPSA